MHKVTLSSLVLRFDCINLLDKKYQYYCKFLKGIIQRNTIKMIGLKCIFMVMPFLLSPLSIIEQYQFICIPLTLLGMIVILLISQLSSVYAYRTLEPVPDQI